MTATVDAEVITSTFSLSRSTIAKHYIAGDGIEIGALHGPLPVSKLARVKYVDRMSTDDLRTQYPELADLELVNVDIIDDGETLNTLEGFTQDFVIANHFLEHCQNPLSAIVNMLRVLKHGGVLYAAIPDKRYTFDKERPVTPNEHIIRDYYEGPEGSREDHFEEFARCFMKNADDEQVSNRANELMKMDYSIHYHVWTQTEILELMLTLKQRLNLQFEIELFLKSHEECIFILRKFMALPPDLSSISSVSSSTRFVIDTIDDIHISDRTQPIVLNSDNTITIRGWAIDEKRKAIAGGVYIDIDGKLFPAQYGLERPDVAKAFNTPAYKHSGFESTIPISELGAGQHVLSIKILTNDRKAYYNPEYGIQIEKLEN